MIDERHVALLLLLQAATAPPQTHKKGIPVLPVKDEIKKSSSEYFSFARILFLIHYKPAGKVAWTDV